MARKKKETPPTGVFADRAVAILDRPEKAGHPVSVVHAGTYLQMVSESDGWANVLFGNVAGYVPADALRR